MPALSHKDTLALLESINILHSDISWETLQERTLKAVMSLIPNEMTVFDGFDTEGEYSGYYWYSPPGTVTPELIAILAELIHEHPAYENVLLRRQSATFRTSELVPLAEFHRTPLYNKVYRLIGGDTQLGTAVNLSPTCYLTSSMYRTGSDFDDREVELLRLLTPHIANAFSNARQFDQTKKHNAYLAAVAAAGLVVLNDQKDVIFISDRAVRLMEKYFTKLRNDGLPEELMRFVDVQNGRLNSNEYFAPADTLRVRQLDSELWVKLAFDFTAHELTLFLEEKTGISQTDLLPLGLTRRETDVMFWLCRGKTDAVIGELCGISVRTVQKHVENIFAKLGVETRSAAAAAAYERTR